jgi:hypothetical protein
MHTSLVDGRSSACLEHIPEAEKNLFCLAGYLRVSESADYRTFTANTHIAKMHQNVSTPDTNNPRPCRHLSPFAILDNSHFRCIPRPRGFPIFWKSHHENRMVSTDYANRPLKKRKYNVGYQINYTKISLVPPPPSRNVQQRKSYPPFHSCRILDPLASLSGVSIRGYCPDIPSIYCSRKVLPSQIF